MGGLRFIERVRTREKRSLTIALISSLGPAATRAVAVDPEQEGGQELADLVVQLVRDVAALGLLDVDQPL
jgi:hypothetical protein